MSNAEKQEFWNIMTFDEEAFKKSLGSYLRVVGYEGYFETPTCAFSDSIEVDDDSDWEYEISEIVYGNLIDDFQNSEIYVSHSGTEYDVEIEIPYEDVKDDFLNRARGTDMQTYVDELATLLMNAIQDAKGELE